MTTQTTARPGEIKIVRELLDLFDQAKGDSEALADVRRQIMEQLDVFLDQLRGHGVDTETLMDEIDHEMYGDLVW